MVGYLTSHRYQQETANLYENGGLTIQSLHENSKKQLEVMERYERL